MADDERMLLIHLCDKFRELREAKGLTLEQTEALGWKDWKHLQRIETQPRDIRISTLFKISKLYGEKMSTILSDIETASGL